MRQTNDYNNETPLTLIELRNRLNQAIETLDIQQAKQDVFPYLHDSSSLDLWSPAFFHNVVKQIHAE